MLGQQTRSPSAQLLVLAVLTGRLDDLDPGVRSFASQLLLGKASRNTQLYMAAQQHVICLSTNFILSCKHVPMSCAAASRGILRRLQMVWAFNTMDESPYHLGLHPDGMGMYHQGVHDGKP